MAHRLAFSCFPLGLLLLGACGLDDRAGAESVPEAGFSQPQLSTRNIALIEHSGLQFRDLNKNGSLEPFEDWRLPSAQRAEDLLQRMSVEEKAGQLAHGNIQPNAPYGQTATGYELGPVETAMREDHITAFISFASLDHLLNIEQNNALQELAERGRLGIPVTVSSDPRHHFVSLFGSPMPDEGYSRWPETLGFAALNDEELMRRFGEIAAREYRATGFSQTLSPQADLATEPRWPRIHHTFGEDPEIASRMTRAYIAGFQGSEEGVVRTGVSAVVKHWVGYGAARDGFDSHNYYGRFADLSSEQLPIHLEPFESAFEVGVSGVMPAYSIFEGLIVDGKAVEQVGASFSEIMISGLLRDRYVYDGVVLSDWSITEDCSVICQNGLTAGESFNPQRDISTGWGVQDLSRPERFALAMQAGVDQFGGVNDTAPILEAIASGLISEARLNQSVKRILELKFTLGLFEAPFADPETAKAVVNSPEVAALALKTQSRAMVVLKRDQQGALLSLEGQNLYLHNADSAAFEDAGYHVVDDIAAADVAIVRLETPYEKLHPHYFFGRLQREGRLDFEDDAVEIELLREMDAKGVRTLVIVTLDRPAVLSNIVPLADGLLVDFGATDEAVMHALTGMTKPEGRLPFELPSSMAAVEAQASGAPADSAAPLFALHFSADR